MRTRESVAADSQDRPSGVGSSAVTRPSCAVAVAIGGTTSRSESPRATAPGLSHVMWRWSLWRSSRQSNALQCIMRMDTRLRALALASAVEHRQQDFLGKVPESGALPHSESMGWLS